MSIITSTLPRKFILISNNKEIVLDDVNPKYQPSQIKEMYFNTYPELLNSTMEYKGVVDNCLRYEFVSVAGTKA